MLEDYANQKIYLKTETGYLPTITNYWNVFIIKDLAPTVPVEKLHAFKKLFTINYIIHCFLFVFGITCFVASLNLKIICVCFTQIFF